jgi:hypothetical protein
MAYGDYQHCAICDTKAFYDANIDWGHQRAKEVGTLCTECAKTYRLAVVARLPGMIEAKADIWINPTPFDGEVKS